ncbi:oligosaccharide flippase family protein [Herbiconiux sp. CPCC 203407]|uniref:Oligosaccharide flippase family protein n=1 Tax=Herbiconiux oxytropis TaxID=2970915 RepID=A0AA41XJD2_9MICO|nr:oligosaccharide flippase family protein [Herbiconiux oxytropis]MCS5723248.1 oligosaccharide flippase family protein [Herbiconiux oxytropis]MCS5727903.1 oligosaccharide flippase family protein [Herbiconiux oxytropis]
MSEPRPFLGQFAWVSAGRIVAALLQALSLILIARNLAPAEFGLLSAVLGLATVAQTGIDMGVSTFTTRERAANRESGAVATALRFNTISSIVLTIIALGALALAGAALSPVYFLMLPLAFWVSGERNADTRLTVAFADGDAKINVFNLLVRRAAAIVLFLGLLVLSVEPVLAYCTSVAIAALGSSFFANRYVKRHVTVPSSITYRELLHQSWPYWLHSVATQARNLDVVVTGAIAGAAQAGFYSAASRLTSPLRILPTSLSTVLLPAASRASAHSHSIKPLVKAVVVVVAIMTVLYGILFVLMPWLVPFALGSAYSPAVPVIQIVLVGLPFAAAVSLIASLLQGQGHKHLVATTSTITTISCLVGVAVGSIFAGAIGAAIALAGSFVLQCAILTTSFLVFNKRNRRQA